MRGDVAHVEERRNAYKILVGKPGGKCLGDLGVDRRIILELIVGK
jgi:hypothetical protein